MGAGAGRWHSSDEASRGQVVDVALDVDVAIIGSGFGGSVAALRLAEKGYSVLVLEAGRRFADADFAKTSWRLKDFLWAPWLGCTGIQRIHVLDDVVVLAGAGVGGGSLVYANTLYVPGQQFFHDPQWSAITDWAAELAPYYDLAGRMLGIADVPGMSPSDYVMQRVADDMGVGHTFRLTPVGVYFGEGPGITRPDPFFGGVGPDRTGCTQCGECMTGCRHNAKNTLPKNYLALAERAGARIWSMATVTGLREGDGGGFEVDVQLSGSWPRRRRTLRAGQVVVAAGTYGTQRLLHRMKDDGSLPLLSPSLGRLTRTNSEALLGAVRTTSPDDYSEGVAITSSFYPQPDTHVEPVRYGRGSNAMGLLQSVLVPAEEGVPRWKSWLRASIADPRAALSSLGVRGWSERSIIALVMQTVDNSVTVQGARTRWGTWRLASRAGAGEKAPSYIPIAHEVVRRMADAMGGRAAGSVVENSGLALTAHFVGGCVISESAASGVIDPYMRVHGYPGLHVVDGSAITANLGVNPSLTITAMAERAMAMWPNKGDPDGRAPQDQAYRPAGQVMPAHPVVPEGAPGELRVV